MPVKVVVVRCGREAERAAGRSAAKQAALALLAVPATDDALAGVEIVAAACELDPPCGRSHRPVAVLSGAVHDRWREMGEPTITISITHADGVAAALAAS